MYEYAPNLDDIADHLESIGLVKEAYEIDKISNTIEAAARTVEFYGLFFDSAEASKLYNPKNSGPLLEKRIPDPHVTFKYMPLKTEYPPKELLGKKYPVTVIGIGRNRDNHGYLVETPKELDQYYLNPARKHITLSISETGEAVNTKDLIFKRIKNPFTVIGRFGYSDGIRTFYKY